jgi:murein DD-endopeptidase MepM/ murein hydrolase activator NlpD
VLSAAVVLLGAGRAHRRLYWASMSLCSGVQGPGDSPAAAATEKRESERSREFLQQNLNAMAVKLGEMQAQLMRLDAVGERLADARGVRPQDFRFSETLGMGGPQASSIAPLRPVACGVQPAARSALAGVENRSDMLGVLEAQLFLQTVNKKLLPTMLPVNAHFNASGFGMRIDPITGQQAMHEGIDFIADTGHSGRGGRRRSRAVRRIPPAIRPRIDIDHGNDLITRVCASFADAGRGRGDREPRAQDRRDRLAAAARPGPHLHFEVRFKGAPQNPARFLLSNGQAVAARAR